MNDRTTDVRRLARRMNDKHGTPEQAAVRVAIKAERLTDDNQTVVGFDPSDPKVAV